MSHVMRACQDEIERLIGERDKLKAENARLRGFVVDLREGWVGNVQERARKVLRAR